MGTTFYPCGCLVTNSMFGDRLVLNVVVCLRHHEDPDIQAHLQALSAALKNKQLEEMEIAGTANDHT